MAKNRKPRQFDIYRAELDPTVGSEIQKTRPCIIISPDEMNDFLKTVIVSPMTKTRRFFPFNVLSTFRGIEGEIRLDQIRTIDKSRLLGYLGHLDADTIEKIKRQIADIFK